MEVFRNYIEQFWIHALLNRLITDSVNVIGIYDTTNGVVLGYVVTITIIRGGHINEFQINYEVTREAPHRFSSELSTSVLFGLTSREYVQIFTIIDEINTNNLPTIEREYNSIVR